MTAQKIIDMELLNIRDIAKKRCSCRVLNILKDSTHMNYFFLLLPFERRYKNIKARTGRLCNIFFTQREQAEL